MDMNDIKRVRDEIFSNYRIERYQRDTGDLYLRNVPAKLNYYWKGERINSLCFRTMDYYCKKCGQGDIPIEEVFEALIDLRDALAHEFELLDKANIERKEKCHG